MLTQSQIDARRSGLGGSDAARLLTGKAWEVWAEKTGVREDGGIQETEPMRWGNILEPVVAGEFSRRIGLELLELPADYTYRDPVRPWMLAHPDRLIVGRDAGLEVKVVGHPRDEEWGDPQDARPLVPLRFHIQCAHYMACFQAREWWLAALFLGVELKIYRIPREPVLEELLIHKEERFWKDNVLEGCPPIGEPGGSAWMTRRHPQDDGSILRSCPESERWAKQLAAVKLAGKVLGNRQDVLESRFKNAMGSAGLLKGDGWQVSWKNDTNTNGHGTTRRFLFSHPMLKRKGISNGD